MFFNAKPHVLLLSLVKAPSSSSSPPLPLSRACRHTSTPPSLPPLLSPRPPPPACPSSAYLSFLLFVLVPLTARFYKANRSDNTEVLNLHQAVFEKFVIHIKI